MIFSELYSAYYNTVARIITAAFDKNTTEKDLDRIVSENAFSESVLTIMPSLKSGKWKLLDDNLKPLLKHEPTMPLTLLQKRWLKAISLDKRVKLFDVQFPDLSDVEPLFTGDDYRIYDKYSDGDNFDDEGYIGRFRLIYYAVKNNLPIIARLNNRYGKEVTLRFFPKGFEYSEKDDKMRVIIDGCKYRQINLGRIINCQLYSGTKPFDEKPKAMQTKVLTLQITDERNALERVMLHFAHFEKQAERIGDNKYLLHLKYYATDETEIVIRVLSFGPCVKVISPENFVGLIKERLEEQIRCGVK
ncbi:MAG: hypothetical protein ACI4JV_05585 [Ruminiclostridium sp.]